MKRFVKMLIIVVIFALFSLSVSAKEPEDYINDYKELLPEEYSSIITDELYPDVGPAALLGEIAKRISGEEGAIAAFFSTLLGVIALSSFAALCPERVRSVTETGVGLIVSVTVGGMLVSLFLKTQESLSSANGFFSSMIPILSSITLAAGGVKSASALAAGMNTALSLVGGGFVASLSAVSGFSFAMGISGSVGGEGAASVGRSVKSLFMWIFGIATALIMGTLSLQTLVSGASDSAAMRSAKYMASGSIPIVGGTVSASLSTLWSGLSFAKGIIGGTSIFVLLVMFLSPLLLLLIYRLMLSVAIGIADFLRLGAPYRSFCAFRSSFDLIIAVYSLSAVLYIFEIILFIKGGVNLS